MGWWWSSSPQSDQAPSPRGNAPPTAPALLDPVAAEPSKPTTPPPPPPLTRDEQAEAEFKSLLAEIQETREDDRPSMLPPNPFKQPARPRPPPREQVEDTTSSRSIAPESLYPTEMSCRQAFDYAFFCQSLGGQFVNVYRYGELRSCSEHWGNFWLCMRSRSYKKAEKEKMIRDHYRKKAIKYKTGPSSEDVWELRKEPVVGAFEGDYLAFERELKESEEAENGK